MNFSSLSFKGGMQEQALLKSWLCGVFFNHELTLRCNRRMLDYDIGIPQVASKYGKLPPGTRWGLNDVACTGTEESLLDCLHSQVLKLY